MTKTLHYASYLVNGEDVYGTAELLNGSGYLFRQDGARQATLVSYKDINLMLYGLCAVADTQYIEDELHGGPVGLCLSRAQEGALMETHTTPTWHVAYTATTGKRYPMVLCKPHALTLHADHPLQVGRRSMWPCDVCRRTEGRQ